MPYIDQIDEPQATGLLRRIYDAAIARAGRVANIIKVMSLDPRSAQGSMQFYTSLMKSPNALSPARREMLATVVSHLKMRQDPSLALNCQIKNYPRRRRRISTNMPTSSIPKPAGSGTAGGAAVLPQFCRTPLSCSSADQTGRLFVDPAVRHTGHAGVLPPIGQHKAEITCADQSVCIIIARDAHIHRVVKH